jgi:excisionase family DNA binding protein
MSTPGTEAATYTLKEAASKLGTTPRYAYEVVRIGKWPTSIIRVGRRVVVPKAELDALLGVQPKPDAAA